MPYFNKSDIPKHLRCYTKHCTYCDRQFYTSKPKTKYCCNTCRAYAFQKRNPNGYSQEKPLTKAELQKHLETLQKQEQQSILFQEKTDFTQLNQGLDLLRAYLLIQEPEQTTIRDEKLLLACIELIKNDTTMVEQLSKYLNK